ncbi:MAG: carbon-nitrogen hydrolase family protein, partial [Lentisphaeria bacterium]|nr:carbon-nitrogen hydrolase family protein [Lentisphaeria bacterium]
MKLCAIQIPFAHSPADAEKSVAMAVSALDKCDSSCDIILTPEYSNAPAAFPQGECIPFAQAHTAALVSAACNAAKRCNAIVAVNYVCEAEPGLFRNTTEIFDRNGISAGRFFKQHLPRAEKNINMLDEEYTRSFRSPDIVEIDGIRFAFLICYDTYFSEYVSHIAHRHPDVILVSSFQRAERKDILRMQNQHLAFNCNAYVLRASVSMGEDAVTGGNSMAVSPDGTILGEFGNQCGIFSCNVDDVKWKFMRSNSFGGKLIPNDQFIEQARATWAYRPGGSMTVESDANMPY